MSDGYPIVLRLDGRRCVVVGGGSRGRAQGRAARSMPEPMWLSSRQTRRAGIDDACANRVGCGVERRPFEPGDLDGAFLAFAATSRPEVNQAVVRGGS